MGFRFRKSVKLPGGFRVNFSKSGVGYSWGAPGARITKTAKGTTRTTVGIPGTGLSYVEESSSKKSKKTKKVYEALEETEVDNLNGMSSNISSSNNPLEISRYNKASKTLASSSKWLTGLAIATVLFFIMLSTELTTLATFLAIFGILAVINLLRYAFSKKNLEEGCNINVESTSKSFQEIANTWTSMTGTSVKIICSVIKNNYSSKSKPNAGSDTIDMNVGLPPYVNTNAPFFSFGYEGNNFYVFPNCILKYNRSSKTIGYVSADDVMFIIGNVIAQVDEDYAENDARVIDTTWEKVNKNGERDKRYKNNKKMLVVNYGKFSIEGSGLNLDFLIPNKKYIDNLIAKINNDCEYTIKIDETPEEVDD